MSATALAAVSAPLVASVLTLTAGRRLPRRGGALGLLAAAVSLGLSLVLVADLATGGHPTNETLHTFVGGVDGEGVTLEFGLLVDPLATLILVVVSVVAALVYLFSLGYMNAEGERDLVRYYAVLDFFTFSMLAFVVADSLLTAFVFFELLGACSYLLIGFWFRESGPPRAATKSFLLTRFGDYFLLVGVVAAFTAFGTTAFAGPDSLVTAAETAIAGDTSYTGLGLSGQRVVDVVGLLVLGGVLGKSAQFPLHTWLSDAHAQAPAPVSAFVHAATMVAAGVYLLARMYGVYALSPTVLAVIALVGGFTALLGATLALAESDLKRLLAYSTVSQYGYVMLALGGGGYVAAVFHLTTHALFKALLVLGAGAVVVATREGDVWALGGLRERLPVTYAAFLAGSLALVGLPPFAGFWSKEAVLFGTLEHGLGGSSVLLVAAALGLLAALVTGAYTARMVLLVFGGRPRTESAADADPVGWQMRVPMVVLGAFAVVGGLLDPPGGLGDLPRLSGWLDGATLAADFALAASTYAGQLEAAAGYEAAGISPLGPALAAAGLAVAGLVAGWSLYRGPDPGPTTRLGRVRTSVTRGYSQNALQAWLVRRVLATSRAANRFDRGVLDGVVDGTGVTALVTGGRLQRVQTGVVSTYAALLVAGLVLLLVAFALLGGWWFPW